MKQQIRSLQNGYQRDLAALAGALVQAGQCKEVCPLCQDPMHVQKTLQRRAVTLAHGQFRVREVVYVCGRRCRQEGSLVTRRDPALAELIPPKSTVGYDVMVYVGIERFVSHRQREEIRGSLEMEHGIHLSCGEISELGKRFVIYLEALHRDSAPALRAALAADGGWPLHIDATCEDGRGTLLVAFAGWRRWVLGAWKIPTERGDAILPKLKEAAAQFGPPCAIMRDLGRAVTEAASGLANNLGLSIPILACHLHFLRDVGTDLLGGAHDKLRNLFRQMELRKDLRGFAREQGRLLGTTIDQAREAFRIWTPESLASPRLPEGSAGMVAVRALAQWALDYAADGNGQDFPFDLPYLNFYVRCLYVAWAVSALLRNPPADKKVAKALQKLDHILRPINGDVSPLEQVAQTLSERARIFTELRVALRFTEGKLKGPEANGPGQTQQALRDIRQSVDNLADSLRQRRPERGPAKDQRQAIDIVLAHLERHGKFLWGHAVPMPDQLGGGVRLVDRTNNILEGFFHTMKHGERRRSGRKNLAQDFERLPPAAALAANLIRPDYVSIVCGSLDQLPLAFARLDARDRSRPQAAISRNGKQSSGMESASLNAVDRGLVRTKELERYVLAAAGCGA